MKVAATVAITTDRINNVEDLSRQIKDMFKQIENQTGIRIILMSNTIVDLTSTELIKETK